MAPQPARPPERLDAGPVVLRRIQRQDASAVAAVVGANLEHLRPWMPWATPEAADERAQLVRIAEAEELWESGTDYIYSILVADGEAAGDEAARGKVAKGELAGGWDGELVGTIGLHRRGGDDTAEIGYWISSARTRRGYGTAAARALTSAAARLPGIRRVEIQCDEANVASAAIPRKLGYRLDRVEAHEREAPGETGRRMIWVWDPAGRDN
jgi:RimJ/RimL family protein N-acetyltransferase